MHIQFGRSSPVSKYSMPAGELKPWRYSALWLLEAAKWYKIEATVLNINTVSSRWMQF
jgi:hypothetical protein